MKRIKNKYYRQFLDEGVIETLDQKDIEKALSNVTGRYAKEGRALLICLYYTGARPSEVLKIFARDVELNKSYVTIKTPATKNGLPRKIFLQRHRKLIKEFYRFAISNFPDLPLFRHYISNHKRLHRTKNGVIKEYQETSRKLRYYFNIWFNHMDEPIPPYFLRHNRFSKLSEKGIDMQQLRMLKGSRTFESIVPYLHMSSKHARTIASKMD